ncbi:MAG: hypothetical protein QMB65_03110, partial [Vicingaceae bacterium]
MDNNENIGLNVDQLKVYFFKGLRYWYVLLIALIIGASYGFYKVRYNVSSYSVSGRILVKDEWKGYGADAFLPGMEVVNDRNRLANEMGIIKSFPLMRNVIDDLPELNVSYYDIGNVRRTEMYKTSPFKLLFDSISNKEIYNKNYSLKIIDEKKFLLSTDNFDNDLGKTYLFNQKIILNDNLIAIKLNHFPGNNFDKKFQFSINNPEALAKLYQDATRLEIDLNEASSILIVSLNGTHAKKETDVINSIMQNFIDYGIDQGNEKGVSTLNFVNQQIDVVANALIIAEPQLEAFKNLENNIKILKIIT